MKIKVSKLLMVLALVMMIGAPLSWAKETAYNYMIAYSYREKAVYYTPIFTSQVDGESAGKDEYTNDTATILRMESAFQMHLQRNMKVNPPDLTVSARTSYKTEEIAKQRMEAEVGDFRFKGFEVKEVTGFNYSN